MKRHYLTHVDDDKFTVPDACKSHSRGYSRLELIDSSVSDASVHMGLGLAEFDHEGYIGPTTHAFEKGFYVLQGTVIATIDGHSHKLDRDHYGLIPKGTTYSFANPRQEPARLLEMMAPQPQAAGSDFIDTWFDAGATPSEADAPDLSDPRIARRFGKFDEASLPSAGTISGVGARSSAISGVSIKEFIDHMLGAHHLAMFLVQFAPGGAGTQHDHPHEESFYFLSGTAEAVLDGEQYTVGPGDVVWTAVGCFHSFENTGDVPVRWIETQAPLPTPAQGFRFRHEWDPVARRATD